MGIIYSNIYYLIMHNYPWNNSFWYYNFKLHEMIDMHSKYDNMQNNEMFYELIYINNYIITYINCILLASDSYVIFKTQSCIHKTYLVYQVKESHT